MVHCMSQTHIHLGSGVLHKHDDEDDDDDDDDNIDTATIGKGSHPSMFMYLVANKLFGVGQVVNIYTLELVNASSQYIMQM